MPVSAPQRHQLQFRYGLEQVLVVPTQSTATIPTGIVEVDDLHGLLHGAGYMPRWQAEYNPDWRQLVSYIVLRQGNRLLLTERLQTQGEARLHSRRSVGVGGHINQLDETDPIDRGWRRELAEEVQLDWEPGPLKPRAIINDLSNDVSRDHMGLLYLLDIPPNRQVQIRETDKMHGQFVDLETICGEYYNQLESWSQMVVSYLREA